MVQKSILSFFGSSSKPKPVPNEQSKSPKKSCPEDSSDSPVKKRGRRSRIIESDSEEDESKEEEKENHKCEVDEIKVSPKKEEKISPLKPQKDLMEAHASKISSAQEDSSLNQPSTSSGITNTKEAPPLRKTARKQMTRKSNSLENKQRQMVKRVKLSLSGNSPEEPKQGVSMETEEKCLKVEKSEPLTDKSGVPSYKRKLAGFAKKDSSPKTGSSKGTKRTSRGTPRKEHSPQKTLHNFFASKSKPDDTDSARPTVAEAKPNSLNNPENGSLKNDTRPKESLKNLTKQRKKEEGTPESKKESASLMKKEANISNLESESLPIKSVKESSPKVCLESPKEISNNSSSPNSPEAAKSNEQSPLKVINEKSTKNLSKKSSSKDSNEKSPLKSPLEKDSKQESSETPSCPKDKKESPLAQKETKKVINPFALMGKKEPEGISYCPDKKKYDPIEDATWKRGQSTPYSALAQTLEIIEGISGRLKTIEILSNLFRSIIVLNPCDLLPCVYLCLNKVAPAFEGLELKVGETFLFKAIAQATGRSVDKIKQDAADKGDLGLVAEQSKSNQRMMFQQARMTVKSVFDKLKEIALITGHSSQAKKIDKIKVMLVACKGPEAKYLIRSLGGKLRIGLAEQSVLQSIAMACFLTPPSQDYPPKVMNASKGLSAEQLKSKIDGYALVLKTAYCECPSYDKVIPILLEHGVMELPNYCKLEPGIPLKPMLAHPTKGVDEVLRRFENAKFTCEYKYDGERAQIHLLEDGSVRIFSRNQEDNTTKYPDIISRLKSSLGPSVSSCILDTEAVAYDLKEKKILPFQILSTRKRKDAAESEITVQVCVFPFDLLYLNGANLVKESFEERRNLLKENFKEVQGKFVFVTSMDSTNTEDIEEFLEESIKGNCEGLMVKTLDVEATYEIAKRSRNWLKLKKDYLDGVGDTIDATIIGGYLGKGKRTGTYGGFLLACYDAQNEEFQSLCKIGTGFTEESLQQHTAFFKEHIIDNPKSYYRFDSGVTPDHWFDAVQVWEIKCADLSISPVHKAAVGIVDQEKGISLRFPRFLRIRDDKAAEEATSASQIADLYRNQDQIKNQKPSKPDDEDFY